MSAAKEKGSGGKAGLKGRPVWQVDNREGSRDRGEGQRPWVGTDEAIWTMMGTQ